MRDASAKKSPAAGHSTRGTGNTVPKKHRSRKKSPVDTLKGKVFSLPVAYLKPIPENAELYRPISPDDPDLQALTESIREHGILEPLVATEDGYILSGHRRWTAAKLAGLSSVPCRMEHVRYADCDDDKVLRLLREHNRQRVKSLDELLREEVVSADPDAAYDALLDHREQLSDMSDFSHSGTIEMQDIGEKRRKGISSRKAGMYAAVAKVINERRDFWPLSDRQVHYYLLSSPPLRNTMRRKSRYANDRASYGDLCDLLTRGRLVGLIPWESIEDQTRPVIHWRCYPNAQDFIRKELDGLFKGYARDLQRTQPNHIEIVAEKLTVRSIVERVASRYCLPVTIGRGYCSIMPRYEMAQRFKATGKDRLIVLILSDFDPDGEGIAESFARSMRDDFHVESLTAIKVALTADQVTDLELVPSMTAKKGSSQYEKFSAQHGDDVFELEAVPPDKLQELLTEAINSVLNVELFNREVEAERQDAAFLETARQRACLALRGMGDGE